MFLKILVLISLVVVVLGKYETDEKKHEPQPYQFGYESKSEHGTQYRKEESDGEGRVVGSYGYTDQDGIYREVHYVADHAGFRAKIKTNEPGTVNKNPSNLQILSSAHHELDTHENPKEYHELVAHEEPKEYRELTATDYLKEYRELIPNDYSKVYSELIADDYPKMYSELIADDYMKKYSDLIADDFPKKYSKSVARDYPNKYLHLVSHNYPKIHRPKHLKYTDVRFFKMGHQSHDDDDDEQKSGDDEESEKNDEEKSSDDEESNEDERQSMYKRSGKHGGHE